MIHTRRSILAGSQRVRVRTGAIAFQNGVPLARHGRRITRFMHSFVGGCVFRLEHVLQLDGLALKQ